MLATGLGLPGRHDDLDDLSPEGFAAQADARTSTLAALRGLTPVDEVDQVTIAAMQERLGCEQDLHDSGLTEMTLNVIASPLQQIRETFDLMPAATAADWAVIAARLARVPVAIDGWLVTLRRSAERGLVAPRRQVSACLAQIEQYTGGSGFFAGLPARAAAAVPGLDQRTMQALHHGVAAARTGYAALAEMLRDELLSAAPSSDRCGADRYALYSRYFLGAQVDLAETYDWGRQELAGIRAQMRQLAETIRPGATVSEALRALDEDPDYRLHGTEALRDWMQQQADDAVARLADHHFDIPDPVRRIECCIAPTQTGGIYYTPPSEDFTRPGRMWWAVPAGVTEFATWRELSTVYHEGVPGHHLQIGQAAHLAAQLNIWRRRLCWTSGHAEGWALYAERLMAELGFLDDPGNRMGMLAGQSLRAARVVIDIGVHCGFPMPTDLGGGPWSYERAWAFLTDSSSMDERFLRFELDRYLGWPGQAPSYKIGERLWLQLRADAEAAAGAQFDLTSFHRNALNLGGLGLDTLRNAMLGSW